MKRFAKVMALFAVFVLTLYAFDKLQPGPQPALTGFAIYETRQLTWDFGAESDYSYDSNLINLSNGEAKLKLVTTTAEVADSHSPALKLPAGNNTELSVTEISDSKYKTAFVKVGDKYYVDKNYKVTAIPAELQGMLWLKTQQSDHDSKKNLSFAANRPTRTFVGYDNRKGTIPDWLQSWTYWGDGIATEDDDATPFKIYYKDFAAGNILLGSNNKSKAMYVILLNNTGYTGSYEYVSAAKSYNGRLKSISFAAEKPEGTSAKLQIRTADTQQGLDSAQSLGPTSTSDYYTTSGEPTNNAHGSSGGWLQYKAVLETTNAANTPSVSLVSIATEEPAYPASAAITTNDYNFQKIAEIIGITADESLSGQTTSYSYSTDSGSSWIAAPLNSAMSVKTGKIRLKLQLNSNTTHTPAIKSATVNFKISICDENWQAGYTGCSISDTRTKYYADANACGSTEDLPADNGTTESCDYCTSEWANVNSSCRSDDTISVNYAYANTCCQETGLPSDCTIPANTTATCDYCTPSFGCSSYGDCSGNNQKTCVQANDMNNCYSQTELSADSYSGDYSEFTASCAYDTEKPSVNSAIAAGIGNTLTVMANITDKSPITAVAHIIKDNNAVMNLTLTNTNVASGGASGIYAASANAAGLDGAYIVSIFAKDSYGNVELAKEIAGLAINAEKSAMKEIALNSTGKALIVLTNSATIEVKGRAGPTEASTTGRIVVAERTRDERNTTKPQERKELGKYIEVEAGETLKSNVSSATLKISYTDEEVAAANVSETSLAIYYYDEPSLLWQLLNSTANAALNYVEGNTTHLSLFGVFGNPQSQATAANATANATINQTTTNATANQTAPGGGEQQQQQQQETLTEQNAAVTAGGGTAEKSQDDKTKQAQKEEEPATAETDRTGESCAYDVRLELAGNPSFINKTMTNATLTNTGTCELQNIEIKATPPLDAYIVIEKENGKKAVLKPLESFGFAIKLKAAADAALQAQQQKQPVQGFVVKEPRKATTRNGKIVITGQGVKGLGLNTESGELQLKEEVSISIEIYELEQNESKSSTAATAIGILVLITLLGMLYNRVRQGRKERGNGSNASGNDKMNEPAAKFSEEKAAAEKPQEEQPRHSPENTQGFEEGLKRFEEKWKEQQKQQQNPFSEKDFAEKAQIENEKSFEGFRETFK